VYAWIAEGIVGPDLEAYERIDAALEEELPTVRAAAPARRPGSDPAPGSRNTMGLMAAMGLKHE
jgi:hypothetical protein